MKLILYIILVVCSLFGLASAKEKKELNILGYRSIDVKGNVCRLGQADGVQPFVAVFIDTDCPIARRYVPELNRLEKLAAKSGIGFYGVISDPEASWKTIAAYKSDYKIEFNIIVDEAGEIANRLKPVRVPEAFIVSKKDTLLYRGRIDDLFVAPGKSRKKATTFDLKKAMLELAAGKPISTPKTQAVGCIFESWKDDLPKIVTYHKHIEPLYRANCIECHTSGGVGPFAFDTFAQVKKKANMSSESIYDKLMPPWKAVKGHGNFRDERHFSQRQLDLVDAWIDGGYKKGSKANAAPARKINKSGWKLGKPDLVLKMSEAFTVPAEGEDIYRYFVLPSGMLKDETVVAIDFKPGDSSVVHHCNFFVDHKGRAREMDAKVPGLGFKVFGKGSFMEYDGANAMGAWAPGTEPSFFPKGYGMWLEKGGDVVLEMHYHLSGKASKDQSEIAFYFAKKPVKHYIDGLFLGTKAVDIPAGEKIYKRHFQMKVPADFTLLDIAPHMHYIGKTCFVQLTEPDGTKKSLIKIDDWDIRWQNVYIFREPMTIKKGSLIDAWFTFDNSNDNHANPHNPAKRMKWGWGSDEEMCELYLTFVPNQEKDRKKIHKAANRTWYQDPSN